MAAIKPRERRAQHRARNGNLVDMNLVSLIDVFTILIFFLLSSAGGVETLASPKAVRLPASMAEQPPRDTVVLVVSPTEILAEGRRVAAVADVLGNDEALIPALLAELERLAARKAVAGGSKEAPRGITILADQQIPYRLLRKVMASCAQAGFVDVQFALRRKVDA